MTKTFKQQGLAHRDLAIVGAAGDVLCPLVEAEVVDPAQVRVVALDLRRGQREALSRPGPLCQGLGSV